MRQTIVTVLFLIPVLSMGQEAVEEPKPEEAGPKPPVVVAPTDLAPQETAPKSQPEPQKDAPSLAGRWGIGANLGSRAGLFVRRWFGEKLALEIGGGGSRDQDSYAYTWGQMDSLIWEVHGVAGAKYNFWRPHSILLIQGLARYEYRHEEIERKSLNTSTLVLTSSRDRGDHNGLFLGFGFELLIPFCKSLSVEGNAGVMGTYSESCERISYEPPVAPPKVQNTRRRLTITASDSGMSPWSLINGKLTYYF